MIQSTTGIIIPVADPQPPKTKLSTFFTSTYLIVFECVNHILTVSLTTIRYRLVAPLCHFWAHYYRGVILRGEAVAMPTHSAIAFIINALLALAEIKSQSVPGFPFQTHPVLIMLSVTTLLIYGLASIAELFISYSGVDPNSVYAVTAHLGKIVSLCILVASLASLFYI